jgi:2-polyprenyl-6-hydroxyphenyl methylase/3-demethylubiquinone-9 3-methyltransferase
MSSEQASSFDLRGLPDPARYDRLVEAMGSGAWWDLKGPLGTLHAFTAIFFDYFSRTLGGFKGRRILDVGCGGGVMAEAMARAGAKVVGVDPSAKSIAVAREHARQAGLEIEYRVGTAEELAFENEFDQVFTVDVLEHVEDVPRTVAGCAHALKPGGTFGFLTHNQTLEAFTLLIWMAEYQRGLIPKGNHDFHKFIRPDWLCDLMRRTGLVAKELRGLKLMTEGEAMRIEIVDDQSVSYLGYALKQA